MARNSAFQTGDDGQEGAPVRITDAGRAWIAARQGGAR